MQKLLRLTFRLYMTFWPAHKATRRVAAGQNVAEKNRTKAAGRLRFFVARAAIGGEAYTVLLCAVVFVFIFSPTTFLSF
jgi:hypothetical protein